MLCGPALALVKNANRSLLSQMISSGSENLILQNGQSSTVQSLSIEIKGKILFASNFYGLRIKYKCIYIKNKKKACKTQKTFTFLKKTLNIQNFPFRIVQSST
jgi:hypothetical protein